QPFSFPDLCALGFRHLSGSVGPAAPEVGKTVRQVGASRRMFFCLVSGVWYWLFVRATFRITTMTTIRARFVLRSFCPSSFLTFQSNTTIRICPLPCLFQFGLDAAMHKPGFDDLEEPHSYLHCLLFFLGNGACD